MTDQQAKDLYVAAAHRMMAAWDSHHGFETKVFNYGDIVFRYGEPWVCRGTSFRPLRDLGPDPWNYPVKMTWWRKLVRWWKTSPAADIKIALALVLIPWGIRILYLAIK